MSEAATRTALDGLVDSIREGNPQKLATRISDQWLDRGTRPREPSPPAVWGDVTAAVFAAFGRPEVTVEDARMEGEALAARLTVAGTHSGALWGYPPSGRRISVTATARVRLDSDKLSVAFGDASTLALLREIGVLPQPAVAHVPLLYPMSLPETVMKMVFNGGVFEKPCSHFDAIKVHEPKTRRCAPCYEAGIGWPALRMCLTCGHVGCCDVSTNKHMLKHHQETGHPLIRSINADERWMWCYVDKTILSPRS